VEKHDQHDEYLEALYHVREREHSDLKSLVEHYNDLHCKDGSNGGFDPGMLQDLEEHNLVVVSNEAVQLTDEGLKKAERIVRRHRLAERLLADVLHMDHAESEAAACEFEHILAEEITDSICVLLGHPRTCPHGSPIPPGACCRVGATQSITAVVPLTEVAIGSTVRVAYINSLSDAQQHHLTHFDVVPGSAIRLHQLSPAVVIAREERMVAMEKALAQNIYVWRNWREAPAGKPEPTDRQRRGLWKRVAALFR
jgi:DtxR family Mn-dependent transcriptional regulator